MKPLRMRQLRDQAEHSVFMLVHTYRAPWSYRLEMSLDPAVRQAVRTTAKPLFDTIWDQVRQMERRENLEV